MDFVKNQIYEITITGMTNEGNGVGRLDGYTVFVPDTAVGDRCRVRLVQCRNSYAYGRLEELLEPSSDRIVSDCDVSIPCGGCTFRHISYEAELQIKADMVRDAFERIGGIQLPLSPVLGSERTNAYRNKAQYPVAPGADGLPVTGFYAKRSHRIIPVRECALQPPVFGQILRVVMAYLCQNRIPAYNAETGKGLVRHIYLRIAEATGEIMLCLVVARAEKKRFEALGRQLSEQFPMVKSFVLNENGKNTNVILGTHCVTVCGEPCITDILCGNRVKLSPLSFYQVNHDQAELLYRKAMEYAQLQSEDILLDLYCGAGTIGLSAARQVKHLIGVEIVSAAVENANENARLNGIENARFLCADAGTAAIQLAEEGIRPDVIVVDPPRKGLDRTVIDAICKMAPRRLVMVSCNPATAARDAALLRERGYEPQAITPVDLFPRTTHVETVVKLVRKKPDAYIDITVDMDELDLTASEAKATYQKIKDYIFEKHNVKVSSLYIAQIKQKYGIIERENYNKPADENARQPKCPPEKEVLIEEALRHFKMIS